MFKVNNEDTRILITATQHINNFFDVQKGSTSFHPIWCKLQCIPQFSQIMMPR